MAGKHRLARVRAGFCLGLIALLGSTASAASDGGSETSGVRWGGAVFPGEGPTAGPFAPKDCATPRKRPTRLVLRCEGFDAIVNWINWRTWGKTRATGSGTFELRGKQYRVKLEIHRVRRRLCSDDRLPMFTRAKLEFRGESPKNFDRTRRLRCSLLDPGWSP
jgi:hypothetical protein